MVSISLQQLYCAEDLCFCQAGAEHGAQRLLVARLGGGGAGAPPLPIPASVYGLLLLAAALKFGVLKLDQVRETGLFLTGIFPLLFVPAAAGVMELGSQLMNLLLPAVLAIVPITALVMAVTGMVAQKCAGGKEHKNG